MRSPYSFIITPKNGNRYDNKKMIEGQEIVMSSSMEDHTVTNRYGLVKALPMYYTGHIEVGDTVIVHHNVFRIYYDMKGREKSSWNHLVDDLFIIEEDQLYLYRKNDDCEWQAPNPFCFIKPIANDNKGEVIQKIGHDKELWGVVKYTNSFMPEVNIGDIVSFTPDSEYEFKIDDERLFRMRYKNICLVKDKKS